MKGKFLEAKCGKMKKKFSLKSLNFNSLKWIFYISRRFLQVDRKGRSRVTSALASLGIAFGVMALIVIVSVMNGFQLGYIDSILEISSFHIRMSEKNISNISNSEASSNISNVATNSSENLATNSTKIENETKTETEIEKFFQFAKNNSDILSVTPFFEGQTLIASKRGKQQGALIRALPTEIMQSDLGFKKEISVLSGEFDISEPNFAVLGADLAYNLGVHVGDTINFLALSGSSDVELLSDNRQFEITGIFSCAYADINASYVFVGNNGNNIEQTKQLFGSNAKPIYGIKLKNANFSQRFCGILAKRFSNFNFESWANYNRSFFGVLKVEKNMLMLLVLLIFVVVGVNIYNGMRRMVFSRKEEICVLAAVGAKIKEIRLLFIMQGFLCGFLGAVPGAVLGIFICHNMNLVFVLMGKISYFFQYAFILVTQPQNAKYLSENSLFSVFASIPPRVVLGEVFTITLFGILSAVLASWGASRAVLRYSLADILHDE